MLRTFTACLGALVREAFPKTWRQEPPHGAAHNVCAECDLCRKLEVTCASE